MAVNKAIYDDPGTILESYQSVPRPLPAAIPAAIPAAVPAARPLAPAIEEVAYRSPYRWTAPRVLICDDGSLEEGEIVYVRGEKCSIGRTTGDILIGHDVAMSSSHAEIARRDVGGRQDWVLQDLRSSNGTFVRARNVTLRPGLTIHLGSRRYRFEAGGGPQSRADQDDEPGTAMLEHQGPSADLLPALVECKTPGTDRQLRHPFRSPRLTIGRAGGGNDIEIDDLCLARTHAVVTRDVGGTWQLESQPSLNGVWVRVDAIRLTDNCHFQCGEQRFRFRL